MRRRFAFAIGRIETRLAILVVALVLGGILSAIVLTIATNAIEERRAFDETVQSDARLIGRMAAANLAQGRTADILSEMKIMLADRSPVRFDVYDIDHDTVFVGAKGMRVEVRQAVDPAVIAARTSRALATIPTSTGVRVVLPVEEAGHVPVVVDVLADYAVGTGRLVSIKVLLMLAAGLAALGLPLGWLTARGIVRPLRRILQAARKVRAGDLQTVMPREAGEIGELSEALDAMLRQVREDADAIHHAALTDPLTGLVNQEFVRRRLDIVFASRTQDVPRAMLLIDIDHFRGINDTHGHHVGDEVLAEIARRFVATLREADFAVAVAHGCQNDDLSQRIGCVARHGSNEFSIILRNHVGPDALQAFANRLCQVARAPFEVYGGSLEVTVSIGVVDFDLGVTDASETMRFANLALAEARRNGRDCAVMFSREFDERSRDKLLLELELRKAIATGELALEYMPKVPLAAGDCQSVEALVRWHHPRRGLLAPGSFLALAEETGLIVDLDRWVLNESCRQAALWAASGRPLTIAVNISAADFQRGDFIEVVLATLDRHGLDPRLLELELTESMATSNPIRVAAIFTQLRAVGIRFAIDDFGTGFSNLGQLTTLSFDVLKVDQSFVRGLGEREDSALIVETILSLAHKLGVETVAEGVQTVEQAAYLHRHGCTMGQGYLFGRPMSADALARHLWPQQEHLRLAS